VKSVGKSLLVGLNQALQYEKMENNAGKVFPYTAYYANHKEKKVYLVEIPHEKYIVNLPNCNWFWCNEDNGKKLIEEGYAAIYKLS
jgi:hypothetical protein